MANRALVSAAVALSLLLGLGACGGSPQPRNEARQKADELFVTARDADSPIRLATGRRLTVTIGGNSSIGDEWSLKAAPPFMQLLSHESTYLGAPGSTGGNSQWVFRFEAKAPGSGELRFEHRYRGEPRPDLIYRVTVE